MDHARGEAVSANGSDLDPDIRRFIRTIAEPDTRIPGSDSAPYPQRAAGRRKRARPGGRAGRGCSRRGSIRSPTRHGPVRVRIHRPDSGILPGLVYLHGGGWTLFSIDTHDRVMREYAARAGCCVIGVDYALSPEQKFPVPLEQTVDVVNWLAEQGPALGIDAQPARHRRRLRRRQPERRGLPGAPRPGVRPAAARHAAQLRRLRVALLRGRLPALWRPGIHARLRGNEPVLAQLHAQRRGRRESARLPAAGVAGRAAARVPGDRRMRHAGRAERRRWRAGCRDAGVPTHSVVYPGASHSFIEAMSIAAVSNQALADASAWLGQVLCGQAGGLAHGVA